MKVKDENYRKILLFIFVVLLRVEILIDLINVLPLFVSLLLFFVFSSFPTQNIYNFQKTKTKNPFACFELKSNKTILSEE